MQSEEVSVTMTAVKTNDRLVLINEQVFLYIRLIKN